MSPQLAFVLGMLTMGAFWWLATLEDDLDDEDDDEDEVDRHKFGRGDD